MQTWKPSQILVFPLLNAFLPERYAIHDTDDAQLSFIDISKERIALWHADARVNCAIGSLGWILDLCNVALQVEARSPANLLADPVVGEDLASALSLVNARLPYSLWTPFAEQWLAGWPESSFKIETLGYQRYPTEMEIHATVDLDEATFRRCWTLVMEPSDQGKRLRRSLGRLQRASASYFFEDVVLNSFIGLEALFADHTSKPGKVALKVTKRATRFIVDPDVSQSVADLVGLSDEIQKLYTIRHAIVHGAEVDDSERNKAARQSLQLLSSAIGTALEGGFQRLRDLDALAKAYQVDLLKAKRRDKFTARGTYREPGP